MGEDSPREKGISPLMIVKILRAECCGNALCAEAAPAVFDGSPGFPPPQTIISLPVQATTAASDASTGERAIVRHEPVIGSKDSPFE